MPSPTWAGVLGITRTIASAPRPWRSVSMVAPATMESTIAPAGTCPLRPAMTVASIWGLTANITTSAPATAAVFSATAATPMLALR
jgi:hypothetical protein